MYHGDVARSVVIGACAVILVFALFQGYSLTRKTQTAEREYADLKEKLGQTQLELQQAQADASYVAHPRNLEKELKSRFNYKGEGEKSIILVPRGGTSTTSTFPARNP